MKTKAPKTVIGIDLGDKKHAICALDKHGDLLAEYPITNTASSLLKLSGKYPGSRIAMEVGTHSPWTSRLLEEAGHEVIVANARKLRAIYTNERKSDQTDARMLARLARFDPELLCPVKHPTERSQRDRLAITLRDTLVRQRVNTISSVRFSLKSLGVRLPKPSGSAFAKRARADLEDSPELLAAIEPALAVLDSLGARIRELDTSIAARVGEGYPEALVLQQIAGVGPITSLSFVLAVGDPSRFGSTRDIGAYFGLVPRRDQSGGSDRELPITKAGNGEMRRLLVQAAHYITGPFGPDCDLRRHGLRLAARGGKAARRRAVIAIARKLAVLMLALWKSGEDYRPLRGQVAA